MPRMYFIGVSTGASSGHRIFSRWAVLAGVDGAVLAPIDLPVAAPAESYRSAVLAIRDDPEALGALVTTHKVGIHRHAGDLFTTLDADAERLGEIGCIVKRGRRMDGLAVDTLTSRLALPHRGPALIIGAGGAAVALATNLPGAILTDLSAERLDQVRRLGFARCIQVRAPEDHDHLLASMPSHSLIVNATGMGKDRPGCPITAAARFPPGSVAWDLNYRGQLLMLDYARAQGARAVDGWEYFLHSWSQIMSRILGFELTPDLFAAMREAAGSVR